MKDDGGSAFPLFDGSAHSGGMTLRDWFAGMALQGICAHEETDNISCSRKPSEAVKVAYEYADAMIEARKK